jgi:hypothetical protein
MVLPPAPAPTAARTDPRPPRPAPPLARPPGPPAAASPAPRAAPPGRPAAGHSGGRRWLIVLAVVLLPVLGYVAAVQVFARARSDGSEPPTARAGVTPGPTGGTKLTCVGGWVEPEPATPLRQAPLDAIRGRLGVDGRFAGVDMRLFTGPDRVKRWYVKAYQEDDPSIRGRWLVAEQRAGERLVVAEAPYDTTGFRLSDWRAVGSGDRGLAAAATGCLAGT